MRRFSKAVLFLFWCWVFFPPLLPAQGKPPKHPFPLVPTPCPPTVPHPADKARAQESAQEKIRSSRIQEKLSSLGFVVTHGPSPFFQKFYRPGWALPRFFTTDWVWRNYQDFLTLLLYRWERAQALRLRRFSRLLLSAARVRPARLRQRVFLLAGPALAFLDPGALDSMEREEAALVRSFLAKMKKGSPFRVPPFRTEVRPMEFRPSWFYAKDPLLSGYWKALTWYRSLPLLPGERPGTGEGVEEEGETALSLARAVLRKGPLGEIFRKMNQDWSRWMGPPMGLDPELLGRAAEKALGRAWMEADLASVWRKVGPNLFNLTRKWPGRFSREDRILGLGFRIFPRRWTPDSLRLCRDCWPAVRARLLPSGLDWVALGPMASPWGKRLFRKEFQGKPWVEEVLSLPPVPLWGSIYCRHFRVLRRILEPCKGAPPVFLSFAWRAKQVWTQLGAAAALGRNFQLHLVGGPSTGFPKHLPPALSPYPDFYKGVGGLLEDSARFISGEEESEVPRPGQEKGKAEKEEAKERGMLRAAFLALARDCAKLADLAGKQWSGPGLTRKEEAFLEDLPVRWSDRFGRVLPENLEDLFLGWRSFFLPRWIGPEGTDKTFYYGDSEGCTLWILLPRKGKVLLHRGRVFGYREGMGPKGLRMGAGPEPPMAFPRFTELFLVGGGSKDAR